jgi:hypothetical protein
MKRTKQFHIVGLVSVLILGFMLIQSVGLIGVWATSEFGFRNSDFGDQFNPQSAIRNWQVRNPQSAIRNLQSVRPWINLHDGVDLPTAYIGAPGLQPVLEQNLALPLALASGDFDEDGVPDLVSGYVGPGGGILTLHRGNLYSIYPHAQGSGVRDQGSDTTGHGPRATDAPPFLPEAQVFEIAAAPEFLGAGDFDNDGHWDVVAAARGGDALYLLPGDGRGGFGSAKQIELPGVVTTLTTGEINRRDGLVDVVVGIVGADGPQTLVFESPEGALRGVMAGAHGGTPVQMTGAGATPVRASVSGRPRWSEAIPLPAEATALALGQLDDSYEMDLAIAAGRELLIVHGRDRKLSLDEIRRAEVPLASVDQRSYPFTITSLALGDFLWDQEHRTEIALLTDDGTVHLLQKAKSNNADEWLLAESATLPLTSNGANVKSAIRNPQSD